MKNILVSVIVPAHNRHEQLPKTLAALHVQSFPRNRFEIVVVDDGSSPPVKFEELPSDIPHHLIRRGGGERSAARNAGADAANGEVLVFIDDDIEVCDGFLAAHWQAQQEWNEVLAVGSIRLPEGRIADSFLRFRRRLEHQELPETRGLVSSPSFCAAGNMSLRREAFRRINGFDEMISSGEDQDLALRHCARGGRIAYIPEAAVVHNDSATDIRSYCQRVEWGYQQIIPFCRRYSELPANIQRERINGKCKPAKDSLQLSYRKFVKSALAWPPATAVLFQLCRGMENFAPRSSVVDRLYRLLLGIHIFRGYRKGSSRYV